MAFCLLLMMLHEFLFIFIWDWCFEAISYISFIFLPISFKFAQELSNLVENGDLASVLRSSHFREFRWCLCRYIVQIKFEWLGVPLGKCIIRDDTFQAHILQLNSFTLIIQQFFIIFDMLWRFMHIVFHLNKNNQNKGSVEAICQGNYYLHRKAKLSFHQRLISPQIRPQGKNYDPRMLSKIEKKWWATVIKRLLSIKRVFRFFGKFDTYDDVYVRFFLFTIWSLACVHFIWIYGLSLFVGIF